jgi:hypothetical protein
LENKMVKLMVHLKGIKKDKMKEYKRECVLVD